MRRFDSDPRLQFSPRKFLASIRKAEFLKVGLVLYAALLPISGAGQGGPGIAIGIRIIVVGSASEARQIVDQLKRGADFAALAKEKSTDPTSVDGGYMGKLDPATLRPELRDALQGVAPGQISRVARIPAGYAILEPLPQSDSPKLDNPDPVRILSAAATGAVRYDIPVAGLAEADAVFNGFPKPDGWNQDVREICAIRKESIPRMYDHLEKILDSASPAFSSQAPLDQMQANYAWAQIHAFQGEMNPAIEKWKAADKIAKSSIPGTNSLMDETFGVAYLHKAEMDNGVYREPDDRCIFPPRPGNSSSKYAKPEDSKQAIEYFSKYLEQKPDDLEVKWLLNLAYMTLGQYPQGVPQKYLIPPDVFESKENIGRFVDVAYETGLRTFSMAGGVIVDDFENNGLLDVITSSQNFCEHLHYFHNNGDGTFTERTEQAGLSDQLGGLNIIQADYNNDGCMDFLVLRGGWEFPMRKSLMRNNCDGTFTDVTRESGLGDSVTSTQTAAWADIDNDGYLDLFIGSENVPSQLFRNRGDGTFEDISESAGINQTAYTKAVVAADYDKDGYVDFYVSNQNGNNFLYHNNHNRTFTEVGKQAGVQAPWRSFGAWFFDYDNDGWPDLYVSSYYASVDEVMRTYLGLPHNAETMKIYKNLGNGTFRDATAEVGLNKTFMPMGANFGDVNNDGYLDMYLGMGNPSFAAELPHVLLLNKEGKSFVDITASSGTGELHKGHGIAFADLFRDGNEDIVAEIGGAVPSDAHALRLFKNPGSGNDWINVHLVGVKTNRAAIGAEINVTVKDEGQPARSIYRTVGSGGSFGANPMEQHIGLGKSAQILNLEVWWPTSNTRQNFSNVGKNQFIEIKEFADSYIKMDRKTVRLGGPKSNPESVAKHTTNNPATNK
jgi:tetratricopeptide (TPR) repeat protein